MGLIVNPRGTAGSGKTEIVRRVLAAYDWQGPGRAEPLFRPGRTRPFAYRLAHPAGGRPLVVLGQYGGTCGGCDTIPARDGGLPAALLLAAERATAGDDVLLEGLALSADGRLSAALAARHPLHVLRLDTPPDRCVQNLLSRRRAGSGAGGALAARLAAKVEAERAALLRACEALRSRATVEALPFDVALDRALVLLGVAPWRASASRAGVTAGGGGGDQSSGGSRNRSVSPGSCPAWVSRTWT
ncbi:hypothetical protein [Rhodospirillum centenum]|uniref:hypothetical protein n=1 Tax=Rhodospirillum centenum TaxID=34018 RepID=UPI0005A292CE|nr:hypothetical protein [Rhodospirillum centenum]